MLRKLFLLFLLLSFPVIAAEDETLFTYEEIGFTSAFPDGVSAVLEVTSQFRLKEAAFFMTMDEVVVYRSEVFIPAHQAGDSLRLTGTWNGVSVTGEISPPWTKMKSWWHLIDEAGNSVITEPAAHLYSVESSRQWVKIEGQAVTLYAYDQPSAFLQQAVHLADDAMQQLSHSYGYSLPYRPAVVFYNSAAEGDADLSPFTRSAFGAYFGGRAYPGTSGIVALAFLSDLPRVIPHELAHLFQFQLGGQFFDAPHWWREGDAKLHEPEETVESGLQRARELAFSGELPDLTTWNELPTEKGQLEDMMSLGLSFLFFLREQYGDSSHAAFYADWRQTRDFFVTFESTYGQTLADLDKQWRGWLLDIPPGQAQVTASSLNIRRGPGTSFDILIQLKHSNLVTPVGRDAAGDWLLVVTDGGQRGWLNRQYIVYAGLIHNLPPQLPQ